MLDPQIRTVVSLQSFKLNQFTVISFGSVVGEDKVTFQSVRIGQFNVGISWLLQLISAVFSLFITMRQ